MRTYYLYAEPSHGPDDFKGMWIDCFQAPDDKEAVQMAQRMTDGPVCAELRENFTNIYFYLMPAKNIKEQYVAAWHWDRNEQ